MEKIDLFDYIDSLELESDDRVEIFLAYIKKSFEQYIEDNLNLIDSGVDQIWLFESFNDEHRDRIEKMIKLYNEYDKEVAITGLEINTDEVNEDYLEKCLAAGDNEAILDVVRQCVVVKAGVREL